jgi:hypothetical protein
MKTKKAKTNEKKKWAWKDKGMVRINSDLEKEDAPKLDQLSYITERTDRKNSSSKILTWLLNYPDRDKILLEMRQHYFATQKAKK